MEHIGATATRLSPVAEEAFRLYSEIKRTGMFEGIKVDEVQILEKRGVISGWNVLVKQVKGNYRADFRDYSDFRTYVTIYANKGSIIVGVGEDIDRNRAVIVYSD